MANVENSQESDHNLLSEEKSFLDSCKKRSWLDGKFFTIDLQKSNIPHSVTALCKTCNKNIKGDAHASSNFSGHLKRKHPEEFEQYIEHKKSKQTPSSQNDDSVKRVMCSFSQRNFEKSVTSFVVESHLAASIVEKPGFRKLFDDFKIKELQHVTAYKVTRTIDNIFYEIRDNLKVILSRVNCVCTTADIWSSKKRRFLGVTVHWIDEKTLERKSAALACSRFPGAHTFQNITTLLMDIHAIFNLNPDKILATITDNGSNFVKSFKEFGITNSNCFATDNTVEVDADKERMELEDNLDTGNDAYDSDSSEIESIEEEDEDRIEFVDQVLQPSLPRHFRCASHTLNLLATTDTKKIISKLREVAEVHENIMSKCQILWKCLNSPKKREEITAYLECNLRRPVETRWNSLYDCLNQIFTLKEKLCNRQMHLITGQTLLLSSDFSYIKEYVDIFKPLAQAIDELQGEKNCYYGFLLPTLIILKRKWTQLKKSQNIVTCQLLVDGLIQRLEERFDDFFSIRGNGELAALAALLHPKFKSSWMPCLDLAAQEKVKNLTQELTKLTDNVEQADETMESDNDDFYDFSSNSNASTSMLTLSFISGTNVNHELAKYLEEPSKQIEILNKYPVIKKMFLQYNTPLPSSAPVERLFSQATLLDLPKLNRMSDSLFEKRIFCKVNSIFS